MQRHPVTRVAPRSSNHCRHVTIRSAHANDGRVTSVKFFFSKKLKQLRMQNYCHLKHYILMFDQFPVVAIDSIVA